MDRNSDYATRILKSSRTFLDRWRGATARVRELTASHPTLRIELARAEPPDEWLEIACIEPSLIHASIQWLHADMSVTYVDNAGDPYFVVSDTAANVELRCGHVEIKERQRPNRR